MQFAFVCSAVLTVALTNSTNLVLDFFHLNWAHGSHNTGSLYVYQFNRFDETNLRQKYKPEKCYENLVSNLIQGVCVAIFEQH